MIKFIVLISNFKSFQNIFNLPIFTCLRKFVDTILRIQLIIEISGGCQQNSGNQITLFSYIELFH